MKFLTLITFCSVIFIVKATERPEYVMLNKLSDNMEIRKYLASKWACTTQTNGESSMFVQLFNYISGQNDKNAKIPMTNPILSIYDDNNKMTGRCFFIPKANQAYTPRPTGSVFILDKPEVTVAVVKFGGAATPDDFLAHKVLLIEKLGDNSAQYLTSNLLTAGYDTKPSKPIAGRVNEVFLIQHN